MVPSDVVKEFSSPKRISTPTFFSRATDTRFLSYAGTYNASRNSTLLALPSLSFTQKIARPFPHSFDSVLLAHPTTPSISSFSSANSFLSFIMWFVQPLSTTRSLLLTSISSFAKNENWTSSFLPESSCCTANLASSVPWLLWFPLNLKQVLKVCPSCSGYEIFPAFDDYYRGKSLGMGKTSLYVLVYCI